MEENKENPHFEQWSTLELYNHLVDLYIIPFEEEFEYWRQFKWDMVRLCKESYENQTIK